MRRVTNAVVKPSCLNYLFVLIFVNHPALSAAHAATRAWPHGPHSSFPLQVHLQPAFQQ